MYGQNLNNSNKALIWGIVALWTLVGFRTTKTYFFSGDEYELIYQIGLIVAWILWIVGLIYIYRTLRVVFKK